MALLYVWKAAELSANGTVSLLGSRSNPISVTVDGKRKDWVGELATATTVTAWDGTNTSEPVSDFDYLYVESSRAVFIELVCDKGAQVGTVVFAKEIQAGQPFDLLTDDAYANYTANFGSGTEDVIDCIRFRNVSGQTATIELTLIT